MGKYYDKIQWIDSYIPNVVPFISVRQEDNLLIKIPNEAFKLNLQGIKVLKVLIEGHSIYDIVEKYDDKETVSRDLHYFFCDLRALLKGCYHEKDQRKAVESIPFTLPFNKLPVLSEIALTYQCNLACQFCYASCGCQKDNGSLDVSTKEIYKILDIIKNEAKVPSVSFTGGEPTLRSDLIEIVRHANSLKMWTNLITNGTLMSASLAKNLKAAGLDSAQVSLEAADGSLHDIIVQKPGAFKATCEGLDHLKSAGIRVHTNTTISKLNKDHLLAIIDLICELGFDKFSMNLLMPEGTALQNLNNILVTYTEIGDIVLNVKDYADHCGVEFMWYSPTPICLFNPIIHGLGNKGCAACDGLLSISPVGDILPCSSYPKPMGNILEMDGRFQEIWRTDDFQYFQNKQYAHDKCQECEELAVCQGACPLYWNHVGYQELFDEKAEKEVCV